MSVPCHPPEQRAANDRIVSRLRPSRPASQDPLCDLQVGILDFTHRVAFQFYLELGMGAGQFLEDGQDLEADAGFFVIQRLADQLMGTAALAR